jgi:hypothetical protein
MKTPNDALMLLFIVLPWLAGIALAKGLVSTTATVLIPPYAWYLVVERALVAIGWASV